MKHLIISFIAPDRPGVVESLSNIVKQYQGNWQSSSMHHLSGYFAGVIEIAIEDIHAESVVEKIKDIPQLESIVKHAHTDSTEQSTSVVLELTANDRAGIIQEISAIIHHQGGNLLKVVSKISAAPHTGQDLFKAKLTLSVAEEQIDHLIDALENLADDLMVDISR